ncbi:hypothetical protein ACJ2A9_02465 [Anaerobacillus sp. MEB173]|uniref:hypothetical protein n=1 Tax=Anaerobacillus sp. MEB173 TaxID=3383345 RepID=UPI003F932E97
MKKQSQVADKVGWTLVPGGGTNESRGGTWIGRVVTISKDSETAHKVLEVIEHVTS